MSIQEIFARLSRIRSSEEALANAWCRARYGWCERDVTSVGSKLVDPGHYSYGMLRLTYPEYNALTELNRRITAKKPSALVSPLLIWVTGRGLFTAIRRH
jgi:hypothetical protein